MIKMLHNIIAAVVGVILIILGLAPTERTCVGGVKQKLTDILTEEYYARPLTVTAYDDKWATGNLTADYPLCPFVTNKGALPEGLKYKSDVELTAQLPERHWGQRKLLLTEIDFFNLSKDSTERAIAVYAGAADGRHIPMLVEMYPNIEFHLYDPRPFYRGLDGYKNIRLNPFYGGSTNTDKKENQHGWFTDEVAEWYASKEGKWCNAKLDGKFQPGTCRTLYFISDIRTVPTEEEVERNQRQQERWIKIMRPRRSMVKFRVPYPHVGQPRTYRHTRGTVRLQCWAPIHSAETRLIVDSNLSDASWDTVRHERACAWFNQIMRTHEFRDRKLRDFGIPVDGTVGAFWSRYVPVSLTPLGFDFVYELQILRDSMPECTEAALHSMVARVNRMLINQGARFQNYLKK
jgi:hypothetical protein